MDRDYSRAVNASPCVDRQLRETTTVVSPGTPDDLVRITGGLTLHAPGTIDDAPATLSFNRARPVSLPWLELASLAEAMGQGSDEAAETESRRGIRSYFESSWGLDHESDRAPGKAEVERLFAEGRIMDSRYVSRHPTAEELSAEEEFENKIRAMEPYGPFWIEVEQTFDDEGKPKAPTGEMVSGVLARHGSGRVYRLLNDEGLTHVDFFNDYRRSWASVTGMQVVVEHPALAAGEEGDPPVPAADFPITTTTIESINLRAPFIEARGIELLTLKELAVKLAAQATTAVDSALAEVVFDAAATAELENRYLNAKMGVHRIDRQLKELRHQAAEMGFGISYTEATAATPASCSLTQTVEETVTWTPTITVSSYVGWLFPRRVTSVIKLPPVSKTVKVEQAVDLSKDLVAERVAELRAEQLDVYLFELTPGGYRTADGDSLEMVMLRCRIDEDSRLRTVIMLPSYEVNLTGERVAVSYTVFHRPVAGTQPIAFPELEVVETLSYKTVWKQAELGELVSSINLAPGEKRTVTVTRTFDRETTTSSTSKSVFDLSSSETTDLATEMERSTRQESDVVTKQGTNYSASASVSASASGSWGMGSASASASATASASGSSSSDKSVKDVGAQMAKTAKKAASTVNQQRKEEMETTSTAKTTVHTSDTSTSVIENINQGRSLNLMFYRVYNRYTGHLFLDDLEIKVRSGTEIVAGSGIRAEYSFSMRQLEAAVDELANTPIPLPGSSDAKWEFREEILRTLSDEALREYQELTAVDDKPVVTFGAKGLPAPSKSLTATPLQSVLDVATSASGRRTSTKKDDVAKRQSKAEESYRDRLTKLTDNLEQMQIQERSITESDLLVAASGLYLDSMVGLRPSTEPYSEDMRALEVRKQQAEIDRIWSESAKNRAAAAKLAAGSNGSVAVDTATILDWSADKNALTMTLNRPLGAGQWRLLQQGTELAVVAASESDPQIIVHQFTNGRPDWATDEAPVFEAAHVDSGYLMKLRPM